MSLKNEFVSRISYLLRRRQFDRELDAEVQFHIETRADELEWSGLARERALMQARREFGSGARACEETRAAWQIAWLEDLARDLRYCGRSLRRSPGFAAAAILSLALGIGANTTVFSVVKAVLLGSLPMRDADRLASFQQANSAARLSYPDFDDYRRRVTAFEDIAASYPAVARSLSTGGGNPERLWGQLVTTNYFRVLGAEPPVGRGFTNDENQSPVAVISDSLWNRRFGADKGIIGGTILLGGRGYIVVGVAPPHFSGSLRGLETGFWIPLGLYSQTVPQLGQGAHGPLEQDRNYPWLNLTARLKNGVSRAGAQAALQAVETELDSGYPTTHGKRRLRLVPADTLAVAPDQARALLGTLMAVVGLVLLVACANVANLLLARSAARSQEIGVRLAIGAGRSRLIRQLLTESIFLSAIGAVFGIALAWIATGLMGGLLSALPYPVALDLTIDGRVLLFTAGLAVLTGVLFGLAPALKSTRVELSWMLKGGGAAISVLRRFGLKNGLVVVQVAVSLVLLVAAGLFLRSLKNSLAVPLGMDPGNVLLLSFDPRAAGYSNDRAEMLFGRLLERVRALPDVASATLADTMPLSFIPNSAGVSRPGEDTLLVADIYGVTSQYFRTLGIPLARGSDFDHGRRTGLPAAVINEALAARLFRGDEPIGRVVNWEGMPHEVIAVAPNVKSRTPAEVARPQMYIPLEREYGYFWGLSGVVLGVRTAGPPAGLIDSIRGQFRDLEPAMPVYHVETMKEHIGRALLVPRLCGTLFGIFGAVALALAAVGLYGVMSYSVRQRTKEIGVRIALGARPADVMGMLARRGIWLTGIGLGVGLILAYSVSRFASAFLYGVGSRDWVTFAGVSLLLFGVAMVAVLVPARRAASMNALRSIRYE
jgi:predicted permease